MKLELCHIDTCLTDYWCGHHRLHISIPVYKGMALWEIKSALHGEISQGAFCGSDALADALREGDSAVYRACKAAINRLAPAKKGQRKFFVDLKETIEDDYQDQVYAYFVFVEL
jgi:hypothetical protein